MASFTASVPSLKASEPLRRTSGIGHAIKLNRAQVARNPSSLEGRSEQTALARHRFLAARNDRPDLRLRALGSGLDHAEALSCQNLDPLTADANASPPQPDTGGGSVLGAVALIVGTSVGAGILALPSETAPAGFIPSATILCASWAFLAVEALLLAEVNVALRQKAGRRAGASPASDVGSDVLSLRSMAHQTLGPAGGAIASAVYVALSYTLLVAYVAKAGDVLSVDPAAMGLEIPFGAAGEWPSLALPELTPWAAGGLFSCVLGGVIYAGGTHQTDMLNRALTAALMVLFGALIVGGSFMADWSELLFMDWSQAPRMVPVVFLSLVFHDLVPVLCSYLHSDLPCIRSAILLGSSLPLLMLLAWDALALSLAGASSSACDPLALLTAGGGPAEAAISAFCFLAIATSFIGTVLSVSEFLMEQLSPLAARLLPPAASNTLCGKEQAEPAAHGQRPSAPSATAGPLAWLRGAAVKAVQPLVGVVRRKAAATSLQEAVRALSFLLVVLPPLAVTAAIPDAFLAASEAAGAYGMTTLYGLFPPLMFWCLLQQSAPSSPAQPSSAAAQRDSADAPGWASALWPELRGSFGGMALASIGACAFAVMVSQAAVDTSLLGLASGPEAVLAAGPALEGRESLLADNLAEGMERSVIT